MKIVITGATGFVGRHLVGELLERGHEITAIARREARYHEMPWAGQVRFLACDLHQAEAMDWGDLGRCDTLIHLAWPGLPNYRDLFHFEQNLPFAYHFIREIVSAGCEQVLVTGTCFEYGLQEGCLSEKLPTFPGNPYGLAKDTLRRFLEMLKEELPFHLTWARLFYMHGPGQSSGSLLAQLDQAIDRGDRVFNMSGGEQLRDYLPVLRVSNYLANIAELAPSDRLVNVCSGIPISVRSLVEQRVKDRAASMELNLGFYPYPDYEPFAFWGDTTILQSLEKVQ